MSVSRARSRVANEIKKAKKAGGDAATQAVQDARRLLAEENLKAYIARVVASAPPLTPDQRDRIAQLLAAAPPSARRRRDDARRRGRAGDGHADGGGRIRGRAPAAPQRAT